MGSEAYFKIYFMKDFSLYRQIIFENMFLNSCIIFELYSSNPLYFS